MVVTKLFTVRVLLAVTSIKNQHLHQLNINNSFLHCDLKEDVYMSAPQGITCNRPNQVFKLIKSLFDLKQASRKWYEKLTYLLLKHGYIQLSTYYSMFTLLRYGHITVLLAYVVDVIFPGTFLSEFDHIKQILHNTFKIKDLGTLKYCLELQVAHSKERIFIS